MVLNIFQLLGIVGLLLCLYEYIAMRHRDICAESDARIDFSFEIFSDLATVTLAEKLYWNRGTK